MQVYESVTRTVQRIVDSDSNEMKLIKQKSYPGVILELNGQEFIFEDYSDVKEFCEALTELSQS